MYVDMPNGGDDGSCDKVMAREEAKQRRLELRSRPVTFDKSERIGMCATFASIPVILIIGMAIIAAQRKNSEDVTTKQERPTAISLQPVQHALPGADMKQTPLLKEPGTEMRRKYSERIAIERKKRITETAGLYPKFNRCFDAKKGRRKKLNCARLEKKIMDNINWLDHR